MMLKNLFFPEKIGTYYLFHKKIVGVHFTPEKIYATILTVQGRSFTLTNCLSLAIPQEKGTLNERTAVALEELLKQIGSYDALISTLPSSLSLFKELRLPFLSKERVSLVLHYELEPYLPFPLSEAAFDSALIKSYPDKGYSDVAIAATQKKYLKDYTHIFAKAENLPSAVTVDMLAVYGLYVLVADLYPLGDQGALVVFDDHVIHIACLQKGTLKAIRSIPKDTVPDEKTWKSFFFTLQSFSQEYGALQRILFMDADANYVTHTQAELGIPCELFRLEKCFPLLSLVTSPATQAKPINIISFAAAYPNSFTTDFTLMTEQSLAQQAVLFKQQVVVAGTLTVIFLAAMFTHTFLQVHKLSNAVESTKAGIVKELRKNFPTIKSNNINEALKVAKNTVAKQEEIWFSFSNQTRRSFLKYLYLLSTKLERDVIGLKLKKLVINKDSIFLEGSVRSFEVVSQFEQELKETNLFVHVPEFEKIEFAQSLTLSNQGDAS